MKRARMVRGPACTLLCLLIAAACTAPMEQTAVFPADGPRLIMLIAVDQLSEDYLVRFRPVLDGGLAWLLDNGVVFGDAHHDHANTVTGAGHATLSTGCYPRHSGIIENQWYDRETGALVYCVQGQRYRRSPVNLEVTSIGDWLKDMDPAAKVWSASGKDRSAILLGGHQADAALWYGGGDWVTTGYYEEPEWLETFNERRWLERYFGSLWEPLPVAPETLDQLDIVLLDEGIYQRDFPYAFGGKSLEPDSSFYSAILSSPFSDMYLAELARTMIEEEDLGGDAHPDLLGLSFSALDYVGHEFGPNSREVLDTIMRLDRTLAGLFTFIDERVGLDNVIIGLSADHGVAPVPAYRLARGEWADRVDMGAIACFQRAGLTLKERYGDYDWLRVGLYLDDDAIASAGLERATVEHDVVELLSRCPDVQHVWTREELEATPPGTPDGDDESSYRQLYANGYYPDRSPDFQVQYVPYHLDTMARGTTHGSAYPYDTWVPLIVVAPGIAPHRVDERVSTTDLAPTLAGLVGIIAPATVDGTDLGDLLRGEGW